MDKIPINEVSKMHVNVHKDMGAADEKSTPFSAITENRVETLKSLAKLLLREVESLNEFSNHNPFRDNEDDHIDLSKEMERFEIEMIRYAMVRANGSQTAAAAMLRTKLTTLHSKIKRYGIETVVSVSRL